jgi:hypothetical protein
MMNSRLTELHAAIQPGGIPRQQRIGRYRQRLAAVRDFDPAYVSSKPVKLRSK